MATKVFSARVPEEKLELADALCKIENGMSFAKYCGTKLLDSICETHALPELNAKNNQEAKQALDEIKAFSKTHHNSDIALLSDNEIRSLIGGRYA